MYTSFKADVTFSLARYSTTPHVQIYTPVHPWVVQYMLNYVLNNSRGVHRQVFHLCMPPYVYWKIEVYQNVTPG